MDCTEKTLAIRGAMDLEWLPRLAARQVTSTVELNDDSFHAETAAHLECLMAFVRLIRTICFQSIRSACWIHCHFVHLIVAGAAFGFGSDVPVVDSPCDFVARQQEHLAPVFSTRYEA